MRQLKLGDKIYSILFKEIQSVLEVNKIIEEFAFVDNMKFKIQPDKDGIVEHIPSIKIFLKVIYCLENKYLIERLKKQDLIQYFIKNKNELDFYELSLEELENINNKVNAGKSVPTLEDSRQIIRPMTIHI